MAATMVVCVLAMSSPVSAQTNPESRTTTASYDDDNGISYGWVGLLGLIGLAGFMKRSRDVRDTRDPISPKYNS